MEYLPNQMDQEEVAMAVACVRLIQYRLAGEPAVHIGRPFGEREIGFRLLFDDQPGDLIDVRCDASGERRRIAHSAVLFREVTPADVDIDKTFGSLGSRGHDPRRHGIPADDRIEAMLQAHPGPEVPLTTIRISGFDPLGEPEIRVMPDDSLVLMFGFMPPSWATDEAQFAHFGEILRDTLRVDVRREDRELFVLTDTMRGTVSKLAQFLQGHLAFPQADLAVPVRSAHAHEFEEAVRAAVAQAERAADGDLHAIFKANIAMLDALSTGLYEITELRSLCGTPLRPEIVFGLIPPHLLLGLAQECQSWFDTHPPEFDEASALGYRPGFTPRPARLLLDALIADGIIRLAPAMRAGQLCFDVHLSEPVQG